MKSQHSRPLKTAVSAFLLAAACSAAPPPPAPGEPGQRMSALLDPASGYAVKAIGIRHWKGKISDQESRELFGFLRTPYGSAESTGMSLVEFNSLKNDIVVAMLATDGNRETLAEELQEMFRDRNLDVTWRDYCIQFLGVVFRDLKDAGRRKSVARTLRRASAEIRGSIAGTALIAMSSNAEAPEIDRKTMEKNAARVAAAERADEGSRATALLIAAGGNGTAIQKTCRQIIEKPSGTRLKAAAIAALGNCGTHTDIELIGKYRLHPDIRLRAAAMAALLKMEKEKEAESPDPTSPAR